MTERLAETDAHEGPVYVAAERALYFTTQRAGRRVDIMRLSLADGRISTVLADAGAANGMTLDRDGRLLVCEQQPAAITRIHPSTGARETVVDAFRGLPLNSPNDVVVKSDGRVVHRPVLRPPARLPPAAALGDRVYRFDPATAPRVVARRLRQAQRPGASRPTSDALRRRQRRDPRPGASTRPARTSGVRVATRPLIATTSATPGFPDGLKVDAAGRLRLVRRGVLVFAPTAPCSREIAVPARRELHLRGPARRPAHHRGRRDLGRHLDATGTLTPRGSHVHHPHQDHHQRRRRRRRAGRRRARRPRA
jgi:gluconolactonase